MIEPREPIPPPTASWAEIFAEQPARSPMLARLSPAERVVALEIRRGLSNKEIAHALGKSEATVKHQVAACLKKCSARNRVQLIVKLG